ncbi:nucleolar protein 9 [Sarocladium implicatum]|nr:nucleolar protein 9 [Sarocladium implicatum]
MPKQRSKRSDRREEKKRKRGDEAEDGTKRQRVDEANDDGYNNGFIPVSDDVPMANAQEQDGPMETEFFGMLDDDEQEYFRRADEMLELNQFPTTEDRDLFLESVFREAEGKELKLASSQSCSRLMERLIQLSTTKQKKHLFSAFADHFLSLVQHRFASHCCEALFLRSAGAVTQELAGFILDTKGAGADGDNEPEQSMENLFLATLDELEGSLGHLITDRFASHTLRVLLLVLSGRPLDDAAAKTLLKSKKKEKISVAGSAAADEQNHGLRAVPGSFTSAIQKIIQDSTSGLDATSLRVLATHPIGNPTLQLLLDLDLTLSKSSSKDKEKEKDESTQPTLLFQFLPGAPKTLADESSEASTFINAMIYDQIGSRLIETLITHAPGKIFKSLKDNIFLPRIHGYVRNDTSCYSAIRLLNRLSKDDLVTAMEKIEPSIPQLVAKERYNVVKTLFERCSVRGLNDEIKKLMKGLREGCGSEPADLVMTLCCLKEKEKKKDAEQLRRNEYAIQSHGAQILTTLLSIPGPSKGVQESLLALPAENLLAVATTSMPTVTILTTALSLPSPNPAFHKRIVSTLLPATPELATSQFGHNYLNAIIEVPSKGRERSIPFHMKEAIMAKLSEHESEMRDCWMGRSVWRNWKGDTWKTRLGDWKAWARELDAQVEASAPKPGQRDGQKMNGGRPGKPDGKPRGGMARS